MPMLSLLPIVLLLLQCEPRGAARGKAPLFMFTTEEDIRETVGVAAGQ